MSAGVQIVRVEKVKSLAGLAARQGHNLRSRQVPNADKNLTPLNENLRPDLKPDIHNVFQDVLQSIGSPRLRKNAVYALEYVFTFSPEAVTHVDVGSWSDRCLAFTEKFHGRDRILSAHLHLDEKTPHVHVLVVPVYNGNVIAKPFVGNKAALRELQDNFHKEVGAAFNLGRHKDRIEGRQHLSPVKLREATGQLKMDLRQNLAALELGVFRLCASVKIEPPKLADAITENARMAYVDSVTIGLKKHLVQGLKNIVATVVPRFDALIETAAQAQLLFEENRAMKSSRIEHARDIDLRVIAEHYFQATGHQEGASTVWETPDHKLVITGQKFHDFKSDQGRLGGGAIDLVTHLWQVSFVDAVSIAECIAPGAARGAAQVYALEKTQNVTPRAEPFDSLLKRWAEPVADKLATAIRYLTEIRKIPLSIVQAVADTGDLWANRFGSCVFAHRRVAGDLKGCTVRSSDFSPTQHAFKQCIGEKNTAWFSVGEARWNEPNLVLCESPIDALSLHALDTVPDAQILSTAGQANFEQLRDAITSTNRKRTLWAAFDNDPAGHRFAAEAVALFGSSTNVLIPVRKDWNDELAIRAELNAHASSSTNRLKIDEAISTFALTEQQPIKLR